MHISYTRYALRNKKDSITGAMCIYLYTKVYHYAALAVAVSLIFHNIVTALQSQRQSTSCREKKLESVERKTFNVNFWRVEEGGVGGKPFLIIGMGKLKS